MSRAGEHPASTRGALVNKNFHSIMSYLGKHNGARGCGECGGAVCGGAGAEGSAIERVERHLLVIAKARDADAAASSSDGDAAHGCAVDARGFNVFDCPERVPGLGRLVFIDC